MSEKRLRILLFYDCIYPESLGGVEHRNRELAAALAERGHEVTLAGWCSEASLPGAAVKVRPLPLRQTLYNSAGKRRASSALRLAAAALALDLRGYDVVEAANIPYMHLPALAVNCGLRRVPLLVSWYEYWGKYWREYLGPWKWPAFAAFEWVSAQFGLRCNAISSLAAERLRQARLRGDLVEIVPSGVPVRRIRDAAAAGRAEGPPLLYAGRLQREKQLDVLLGAVQRMVAEGDGKILRIIGDGPDRVRLEHLASELGVGKKVEFLGRLDSSEEVWRRYGEALVAVQPSAREGFGLFPLEAMAAGLPVVYCESSESAVGELVRDGIEGRSAAPTAPALSETLVGILEDRVALRRLSSNARARASGFDWEAVAGRFEGLCYSLLEA